ncbi:site-specific integrase [Xanthomonas fragariae]|nr:site-specific integrase [Xanthomonas fragariae]AOD15975.1 integrase [Xanthomonas fragariae]AOD19399.1 integrase [Xanthomonas fragariae]MBL9197379.1 site-specific integrase [Xanthomonas fragariae]MBL9223057.1 site-specific integrase [Xanthomonas fragariae]MDM7556087.1 site-specific integrase [Xanthomonas fragariae]
MPKPYFLRRPAGLYVRFFVPTDLQALIGSRYLVRPVRLALGDADRLAVARTAVALSEAFDRMRQDASMKDDLLSQALASLQRNEARPYTIKVGGVELSASGAEDHARLLDALKHLPLQQLASMKNAGPLLSERATIHINEMRRVGRSAKNVLDTEHSLSLFLALVGDKPVEDYKTDDVRKFLDALEHYPSNATKKAVFGGLTPVEILNKARQGGHELLSMRTKEKHRDRIASFFNALANEDLISKAPHKAILNRAKSLTDEPSRDPFSQAELEALLELNAFTSWAKKYPHRWFGTLLGFATGARVNEAAQLYVDDIGKVGDFWGVHFRAAKPDQRLKNPHSSRFVPLPTSLIEAGFLVYVDEVKRAGFERLFPHLPYNAENGYGDALGDQFRAYAIKRGLTQRLKSFHCFRHTLSNALVNEHSISLPISQQITGHELTPPPGLKHYVDPPSVPARFAAIERFGPPLPLPAYTPGQFDRAFKQVRHMERRREQAAQKRTNKTRTTGWRN